MTTAAPCTLDRDASLAGRNTLRVAATSRWLATVHDPAALAGLLDRRELRDLPLLVLGEGSNVLFAAPVFEGLVLHLACDRIALVADDAASGTLVRVEAGRGWDPLVDWTLAQGLAGLENLALIPGQAGAAPIQNIGAYGVEVGEFVEAVYVFDRTTARPARLAAAQCGFAYRDSTFKRDPDRWIVTALDLRLPQASGHATRTSYAGVREELAAMGNLEATARNVAHAVRRIRRRKLPDPAAIGNAGSFFKNPVVAAEVAAELQARFGAVPVFPAATASTRKLSAAWLIEQAGWRGHRTGDAGVSAQHALVLVNHGRASGVELLDLARRVADSVERRFGVRLEPEPRIVGAAF